MRVEGKDGWLTCRSGVEDVGGVGWPVRHTHIHTTPTSTPHLHPRPQSLLPTGLGSASVVTHAQRPHGSCAAPQSPHSKLLRHPSDPMSRWGEHAGANCWGETLSPSARFRAVRDPWTNVHAVSARARATTWCRQLRTSGQNHQPRSMGRAGTRSSQVHISVRSGRGHTRTLRGRQSSPKSQCPPLGV